MRQISCVLSFGVFWVLACSGEPTTPKSPPTEPTPNTVSPINVLIDVPSLALKTPKEIESIIGKSVAIEKITHPYVDQMPGEFRNYDIKECDDWMLVRFYKGKAVAFTVQPTGAGSPEDALKRIGIDIEDKPTKQHKGYTAWTPLDYKGIHFKDVAVQLRDNGSWQMINIAVE